MTSVLLGGAVFASFLAGMVALLAPCCISVMLPAYFASSFATRRALVAMTFVFAAGLGLVILPIALGAAAIGSLISGNHRIVFLAGGLMMLAMGVYMVVGGRLSLPAPAMRARGRGAVGVFSLGAVSGVASSCCAPVLVGVAALSGASGSFGAALVLGVAFVFGMVFPLFVMALAWDRFNWGESRLLKGKRLSVSAFGWRRDVHSTALVAGLILVAMGAVSLVIGIQGSAMPSSGWQLGLSARLQHYAALVKDWVGVVPGWITALAVITGLAALTWKALGQAVKPAQPPRRDDGEAVENRHVPQTPVVLKEELVEQQEYSSAP